MKANQLLRSFFYLFVWFTLIRLVSPSGLRGARASTASDSTDVCSFPQENPLLLDLGDDYFSREVSLENCYPIEQTENAKMRQALEQYTGVVCGTRNRKEAPRVYFFGEEHRTDDSLDAMVVIKQLSSSKDTIYFEKVPLDAGPVKCQKIHYQQISKLLFNPGVRCGGWNDSLEQQERHLTDSSYRSSKILRFYLRHRNKMLETFTDSQLHQIIGALIRETKKMIKKDLPGLMKKIPLTSGKYRLVHHNAGEISDLASLLLDTRIDLSMLTEIKSRRKKGETYQAIFASLDAELEASSSQLAQDRISLSNAHAIANMRQFLATHHSEAAFFLMGAKHFVPVDETLHVDYESPVKKDQPIYELRRELEESQESYALLTPTRFAQ